MFSGKILSKFEKKYNKNIYKRKLAILQ